MPVWVDRDTVEGRMDHLGFPRGELFAPLTDWIGELAMLLFVTDDQPLEKGLLKRLREIFRINDAYTPTSAALLKTAFNKTLFKEESLPDSPTQFKALCNARDRADWPNKAESIAEAILAAQGHGDPILRAWLHEKVRVEDGENKVQALLRAARRRAYSPIVVKTLQRAMQTHGCSINSANAIALALALDYEDLIRPVPPGGRSARPKEARTLTCLAEYARKHEMVVSRDYVRAAVSVLGNDRRGRRLLENRMADRLTARLEGVWQRCEQRLREELSPREYDTLIRPLQARQARWESGKLLLLAPDQNVKDEVESHHLPCIEELVAQYDVAGDIRCVEVKIGSVKLPNGLATRLEVACGERHRPKVDLQTRWRTVTLPSWFSPSGSSRRVIRISVDPRGRPTRMRGSVPWLPLWPQTDDRRTERCRRWARRMLIDLERVLGRAPLKSESDWLYSAEKAPEKAERAALAVWGRFVASFALEVLRGWPLHLYDLERLCRTATRHEFAIGWTWAAWSVADADLDRLDAGAAGDPRVFVASKALCCRGIAGCRKTLALARQLPSIDRDAQRVVFGVDENSAPHSNRERAFRAVLLAADDEELPLPDRLQHEVVREQPELVREQVEFALDVVSELGIGGSTLFTVGGLISSTLVGTRSSPRSLGRSGTLAVAFHRAAACIAPFAADDDDQVRAAVSALAAFFREQRLTLRELADWAATMAPASRRGVALALPAGWDKHNGHESGATLLRSMDEILAESERTAIHRRGRYEYRTAAGDVHQFALRSSSDRFALRSNPERAIAVLREHRDAFGYVVGYSLLEVSVSFGREPSEGMIRRVETLLADLNSKLPARLSEDELDRRGLPRDLLDSVNCPSCSERESATRMWRDHYALALPERLRRSLPEEIAATVQTALGECAIQLSDDLARS